MTEHTKTVANPLKSAERKGANIIAYAIMVVGIGAVLHGGFLAGGLLLAGSFVLMPRFPFFGDLHPIIGWALIGLAFATLS